MNDMYKNTHGIEEEELAHLLDKNEVVEEVNEVVEGFIVPTYLEEGALIPGKVYRGAYKNLEKYAYYSGHGVFRVMLVERSIFMTAQYGGFMPIEETQDTTEEAVAKIFDKFKLKA